MLKRTSISFKLVNTCSTFLTIIHSEVKTFRPRSTEYPRSVAIKGSLPSKRQTHLLNANCNLFVFKGAVKLECNPLMYLTLSYNEYQ